MEQGEDRLRQYREVVAMWEALAPARRAACGATERDAPSARVDGERADHEHLGRGGLAVLVAGAVHGAQQGPDAGHDLAHPEGLRDVVVGADTQADE